MEDLRAYAESIDGWRVLDVDAHAATKLAALLDRPESMPGEKDRAELFAVLPALDPSRLAARLAVASRLATDELVVAVDEGFDYLKDLGEVGRSERRAIGAFVAGSVAAVREARSGR